MTKQQQYHTRIGPGSDRFIAKTPIYRPSCTGMRVRWAVCTASWRLTFMSNLSFSPLGMLAEMAIYVEFEFAIITSQSSSTRHQVW